MTPDESSPSDCEIVISRDFNAPRDWVFKIWTDPTHVARWWGPRGFDTTVVEMDLRSGGRWVNVMRGPDGSNYPCYGIFKEVVMNERIVTTDEFSEGYPTVADGALPRDIISTTTFEATGQRTRVTIRLEHASIEDRQKHEQMGIVAGWNSSADCFEEYLDTRMETPDLLLKVTRFFSAPPQHVFDAWLDPKTAGQWLFRTPKGELVRIEMDARVGGQFYIAERRGEILAEHFGQFCEISSPHRLVFTFGVTKDELNSRITLEFESSEDGCLLMLTHRMPRAWIDYLERTCAGWKGILLSLASYVK